MKVCCPSSGRYLSLHRLDNFATLGLKYSNLLILLCFSVPRDECKRADQFISLDYASFTIIIMGQETKKEW